MTTATRNDNGLQTKSSLVDRFSLRLTKPPIEAFAAWLFSVLVAGLNWLRSVNWKLVLWNAVTLPLVGLIYWVVNAQGIRAQMPVFALRLHKIPLPGFSYLRDFEGLYHLDLAHVLAVLLLGFVWYFWIVTVKVLLYGHDEVADPRLNHHTYYLFLFTLAGVLILGDAIVFYCGLFDHVDSLWGETSPFVPIVATMLYMALLAATSMVHVHLVVRHKTART